MAGSPTCEAIQPGDPMESLNQTLFLWLNAPEHPSALALTLAVFFAERLIWAMPLRRESIVSSDCGGAVSMSSAWP